MLGLGKGAMMETSFASFMLVSAFGWVSLWSWEVEGLWVNGGGAGPGGGTSAGSDSVPSAMISREDVEAAAGSSWMVTFRFFFGGGVAWIRENRLVHRQSHVWIWLWY